MPEEMTWIPRGEILTFEEIQRVLGIVSRLGIDKVRLTGGEPTLRSDLPDLIRMIHAVEGIRDVGLTTNGFRLSTLARPLYDAGLRRLNISLDTLQRHKFHQMARRDAFEQVMEGLWEAGRLGFHPIKLNAVTMRGYTEDEALDFAELARERDFQIRFIEFMPLDADGIWGRNLSFRVRTSLTGSTPSSRWSRCPTMGRSRPLVFGSGMGARGRSGSSPR